MNEIQLTDDQIIDLIFERKIDLGQTKISCDNSFHEILGKLEQRLCYGKIPRSKDSTLCRNDDKSNSGTRVEVVDRPVSARRKKVYDLV
jgi:hypothetical protein